MTKFWLGFLACGCVHSLIQDAIGKEEFLALVDRHWIPGVVSVPLALVGLVAVAWMYKRE